MSDKYKLTPKEITAVAIPAIVSQLIFFVTCIIDIRMIAVLGKEAIAGLYVTLQPIAVLMSIPTAIGIVVSALVSVSKGEKDRHKMNVVFTTAMCISFAVCAVICIISQVFATDIIALCCDNKDVRGDAEQYFTIAIAAIVFMSMTQCAMGALRGNGSTQIVMKIGIVGSIVNLGLDYLLITGKYGFPALGIKGAAWATFFTMFVSLICYLGVLWSEKNEVSIKYCIRNCCFYSIKWAKEITNMSLSVCGESFFMRLGLLVVYYICSTLTTSEIAVSSVVSQLMNLNFAIGMGLQVSAMVFAGRSWGEKDMEKLDAYVHKITVYGIVASAMLALVYLVCNTQIFNLVLDNESLASEGAPLAWIIALLVPFQIVQLIYNGCLKCMEDAKYTMVSSIFCVTGLNVVMAYLLVKLFAAGGIGCRKEDRRCGGRLQ